MMNQDDLDLLSLMNTSFTQGNQIQRLKNGVQTFEAMIESLEEAEEFIDFQSYVYSKGRIAKKIAEIFLKKARSGVRVRVLVDSLGGKDMDEEVRKIFLRPEIHFRTFRAPFSRHFLNMNHRSHRRVLICDGKVAYTGGVGIAEEWEGNARYSHEWRDTNFQIKGPLVNHLSGIFLENWCESTHGIIDLSQEKFKYLPCQGSAQAFCIRSKPNFGSSQYLILIQALLQQAKKEVYINVPYFLPGNRISQLLCEVQKKGIKMKILLPGKYIDHRVSQLASGIYMGELLNAGVEIWSYQKTMIHSKVILIDDSLICVGSINLNQRSFKKDEEMALVIRDEALFQTLKEDFMEDLNHSILLTPESWEKRPFYKKVVEKLLYPFKNNL